MPDLHRFHRFSFKNEKEQLTLTTMKNTNTNSAKIRHDQFEEETISKRRNTKDSKRALKLITNYQEGIGLFVSKRNLPNVLY